MFNSLSIDFISALNPLYAFPIVAVIVCAFIVYAFGFKSPVQPPSFDGIEEDKKVNRKRKPHAKDTNKGKVVQNGKLNGNTSNANKNQVLSAKKKTTEKSTAADKSTGEKALTDKKANKKAKSNEKKMVQEKKEKMSQSQEDVGEDGWVQLVSKKGRKSRKKDEIVTAESHTVKSLKKSVVETTFSEEYTAEVDVNEKPVSEKKLVMKDNAEDKTVPSAENLAKVIVIEEESTPNDSHVEEIPLKSELNIEKSNKEMSNKSKKKMKKKAEVVNTNNDYALSQPELPAVQVVPEIPPKNDTPLVIGTPKIIADNRQEEPKELKSSNVAFDELADLYPKEKETKKKKKVRRDH